MKMILTTLLAFITGTTAFAHSAHLQYFSKPEPMVISIGDKPKPSGQIVVLTDSNVHERFNVHGMRNIYVVCRHGLDQYDNKPCRMVVIIGDQIIEEIDGRPVIHKSKGSPWKI